jgi:Kef-type K+ transport system membrane component KefB
MELLYILLILLFVTRFAGEVAVRFGQPALIGELLSGVALGVIATQYGGALPVIAALPDNEVFKALTDLAIFFLMLLAGVQMSPRELSESSRSALWVALGGLLLPLASGLALGWWFIPESEYRLAQILFLATALSITAVPVSVKVLMDLGKLDSAIGRTIVSAAVFDDIFSLVLLAVLTAVIATGELPDAANIALLLGRIAAFFVLATLIGYYVFPWIGRLMKRSRLAEFEFSGLLIVALVYALIAEALGIHFIIGAFLAGLFFVRKTVDDEVYQAIKARLETCTSGFLGPLFFASIGLHLDLGAAFEIPLFVVILVVLAFLGKLVGAGLPAYWTGLDRRNAVGVGAGMSARGAVELIIADIALRAGLFGRPDPPPPLIEYLFSAVVLMAILTTLVTPLALKRILGRA